MRIQKNISIDSETNMIIERLGRGFNFSNFVRDQILEHYGTPTALAVVKQQHVEKAKEFEDLLVTRDNQPIGPALTPEEIINENLDFWLDCALILSLPAENMDLGQMINTWHGIAKKNQYPTMTFDEYVDCLKATIEHNEFKIKIALRSKDTKRPIKNFIALAEAQRKFANRAGQKPQTGFMKKVETGENEA
jgi:hypothetical protein